VGGRAVLSLGKLAPGQQQYYLDTVARGFEEYYTGAKEAPGVWVGSGSARLGLAGEVDAEALHRVLEHVDPSGVYRLTASRSVPVVAGFDVTFCAPKSVSLLFALGPPGVSNEVRNAADAAMAGSLEVLERVACRVRRGQGGQTVVDADGFVAAAFRHRTSRAGDPHLHTHVVIANLAHAPSDGRWTALDGRPLYSWLSPVGHLYEAHLRWELTRRLGVAWGPVRNGIADIANIPRPVLREFSTRRREIEAHLDEHGQHSARAAQYATYATRRAKDTSIETEGLVPGWKARAAALGLDTEALAAVLDRGVVVEPPSLGSPGAERLYRWLASAESLTARASTFGEREVIKAICNALPAGGSVDRVLDLADGFLRSDHVLAVRLDRGTTTIRRADGVVIPARTDEIRWTTPEMLEIESGIVSSALGRRSTGVGVATRAAVEAAVAAGWSLSVEQRAMVRTICGSGDGIEIVEGVAGAGKTFALAAARGAWDASGYRVIGCSLAARAARQLQDDAEIPAATIDRLLGDLERSNGLGLDARTVIVVDEAAMVGTRKLARLLARAEAAQSKVVLVGDPCQLPEIDAGGAFRSLQHRLGASRLIENRRQTQAWERAALAELRAGDTDSAVDAYLRHERIHRASTNDEARELLVDRWMSARAAGEDGLMVAGRLLDVDDLNRRARSVLRARGGLGPDRVVLAGRGFAEGDDVLALRNDYRHGLLNGTRAAIHRIDIDRRHIVAHTDNDQRLVIPFHYAANGHLTHGYATTVHKAQGATVDRCFVLVDDAASREHAYTAASRGRHGNDLFVVAADRCSEERHAAEVQPDPREGLRAAVKRSSAQRFALDELQAGSTTQLEQLRRERDLLRARLSQPPPDPSWDVRTLTEERQHEQLDRDRACRRRDVARQNLDRLGPVGRRAHPARRRQIEDRIARANGEIVRQDVKVADLDRQLEAHAPAVAARATWERQHGVELQRLHDLDRNIELIERLDHLATRRLERGAERSLGIEL
jgi:conjugative relaxase-like TrwC/TraI family protein